MKLSRASSYALHAVVHLAQQQSAEPVASHVIAEARGLPERFLLKVLKPLVGLRLLTSVKGPHGGYKLLAEPAAISLLQIIEAVDGPLRGQAPFTRDGDALNGKLEAACLGGAQILRDQLAAV